MPGFLTHWHVLIETARHSQDAGNDLGSLITDATALRRRAHGWVAPPQTTPAGAVWNTGPLPEIDYRFPGSDVSAMAYLGALAPDIPYYQKAYFREKLADDYQSTHPDPQQPSTGEQIHWGKLLHQNRSGDVMITFLERIADIPSPALRSQALAFAMGYLTHIATDLALNPCINALAAVYQKSEIAGLFTPAGMRFYTALCLDEYIAESNFRQPLYSWVRQPWEHYIEPAARSFITPTSLSGQVLTLLSVAAEETYALTDEQKLAFHHDFLAGLQRLQRYLAGRGTYRLLKSKILRRKRDHDPIIATITASNTQETHDVVDFGQVITYAIRLSERLCRLAIGYYAALRNTQATASERNQRRTALCEDVRNWNLDSGYTMEVSFDEEVTLSLLHNWVHFARLWENEQEALAQARQR